MRHDIAGRERGQVLPLTALFMTSLLLLAALAIDVTSVLSAERFYTTTADAAALAGAQDLQKAKSRLIDGDDQARARGHAMEVLMDRLGATGTPTGDGCLTSGNITDCALPGTPYLVDIVTPSPSCVSCEPQRSVQVSIQNPSYGLTFAGLVGQRAWNVEASAVAGLQFAAKYAVQTLRPPHPLPNAIDQNRENISVDGTNTWVDVPRGDVGTNTSAYTNSGGRLTLATGYRIDHIDDITPDPWNQINGLPEGRLIQKLIPDPMYTIAQFPDLGGVTPRFGRQEDGRWDAVAGHDLPCPEPGSDGFPPATVGVGVDERDNWPVLRDPAMDVVCYRPGWYEDNQGFNVSANTEVAYLLPGAYYFDKKGLDVGGSLMGGLISGQPGVTIVIPQTADLAGNNSVAIVLNHGDESCEADSCRAAPARDFAGSEVISSDGLLITIAVPRDETCFDGTTPLDVNSCTTGNSTISLPGNGNLSVTGVVYAPSDNAQINGDNSTQVGEVGQLIAWTVKYGGGAKLQQIYPPPDQVGVVRLDAACTGLEVCSPT